MTHSDTSTTREKTSLFCRLVNLKTMAVGTILALPLSFAVLTGAVRHQQAKESQLNEKAWADRAAAEKETARKTGKKHHPANPVRSKSAKLLDYIGQNHPQYLKTAEKIVSDIEDRVDPMVREELNKAADGMTFLNRQARFLHVAHLNTRKI